MRFSVYNFIDMNNFNINIPSIPTKSIQFKIQDAKIKGFSSKQSRFKDNLSYLTNHFINSFPNILAPKTTKNDNQTQLSNSEVSTNLSRNFRKNNNNFRVIIGDDKKNLLLKYEESYKDYIPQIPLQNKYDKGFSFGKSSITDTLDSELLKYPSQTSEKRKQTVIDNYYFSNKTEESIDEEDDDLKMREKRRAEKLEEKKVVRKSAVFESEDRWKSLERQIKSKIKPGPGSYSVKTPLSPKIKSNPKLENSSKQSGLLERIKKIMNQPPNPERSQKQSFEKDEKKEEKKSSMFADASVDRFGNQIYPMSPKLNVPGPGAYNFFDSLEDKANRILVVEEQRKLLKQWYND